MEFVHPNELQKIPEWAGIASQYIGACFYCARPLMNVNRNTEPYIMEGTVQLFSCCHFTSESVLILIANGKEWDADILMRSVAEGRGPLSISICYWEVPKNKNESLLSIGKSFLYFLL